jgi:hypothetical protein
LRLFTETCIIGVPRRNTMTTLRYKLFGIGKLPDEMRSAVENEGVLHLYEGVSVAYEFSGKLPGLIVGGTNTRSYSGALALTKRRILGTLSVVPKLEGQAINHEWSATASGPLKVTIDERGVLMKLDLADVDAEWIGHLSLHYELTFSPDELKDIPVTTFSLSVPPEWVLKLAGVPT